MRGEARLALPAIIRPHAPEHHWSRLPVLCYSVCSFTLFLCVDVHDTLVCQSVSRVFKDIEIPFVKEQRKYKD